MADADLTRRNLLIQGGLLAAAALPVAVANAAGGAATPLAPPDKQPPNLGVPTVQKKVGWAIMGLGELALNQILPGFAKAEHSAPVALVSGHPDKAKQVAAKYGVPESAIYGYDDLSKLKDNPAVDVVYNVLPNHMHAEYTIKSFAAGKHVLCEKPMAPTAKECEAMIAAGKQANKKLMIAYRLHYEPYNLKASELTTKGSIGRLKSLEAQDCQNTYAPNIRLSNATKGGPLGDVGIYCLNAARYLTGEEPVEVWGTQHQPKEESRFAEVPESVMFTLRFPSGCLAMCVCSFGTDASNRFRVVGDSGWVELDPAFAYNGQKLRTQGGKTRYEFQLPQIDQFAAEMDHFSQCVMNDETPKTPGEEGLQDIRIIEKINASIASGRAVKIA
jgi:predicted dehydrogenase